MDTWKQLPEYQGNSTFDEFKDAVWTLYPGAKVGSKWSIGNLDRLVGETTQLGIVSAEDFSRYHQSFFNISEYLVSQNVMSRSDQSHMFMHVFSLEVLDRILNRLSVSILAQLSNTLYVLADIKSAVEFILEGPGRLYRAVGEYHEPMTQMQSPYHLQPLVYPPSQPAPPQYLVSRPPQNQIKMEDFALMMEQMTQNIISALDNRKEMVPAVKTTPPNHNCNGCGELGHYLAECPIILRYIQEDKCKRSAEGRVVLLSGSHLPNTILGRTLCE
jgi:hypothetical protein